MIQLFSFFFIASICTVLTGNFFLNLFLNQNNKYEFSFSEKGMYGLIILSFISLFINFFYKIDYFIASVLFLIPAIFIIINLKNISKKFIKKIIIHSIIISLIACIFIAFDNIQRPDGGTYHLPYTKIINDYKIFLGVANLNPFFGVTSIFQYTSAIYNNFLFKDIGIVIPLALLAGFFIDYFFRQFFLNKNSNDLFYKFYIFSIISYFFIEMNRYSDYGNDNPAHIYFFYLLSLVLRKDFILSDKTNFKLFTLISLFCFLNRPFLILSLFFPVFYWFKNKLYLSFKSFPFFSLLFLFLWIIKNFLTTGCGIYPLSFTCNDNLSWYSSKPTFRIAAKSVSQFSELHAKGWKYIINRVDYQNYSVKSEEKKKYLENFNWLNLEWIKRHSFTIKKKVDIFIVYLFIVGLFIYLFKDNKKKIKFSSFKDLRLSSFFIISLIGVLLLIYKFPLGRYGTSYMVLIIVCLLYPLFYYLFNQSTSGRIYKILFTFIIILSIVALAKNFKRIIINYEAGYNGAPWPRIYDHNFEMKGSNKKDNLPMKFNTINKNGIIDLHYIVNTNFYLSQRVTLCLYNKSPCAQSSENFDNFSIENKKGYYLIKLKK